MKRFRLVDNALGWVAFLIAAFTYCSTVEPTASFWDCPEFILTAFKQEVGHPPGAPFFMLTGNLFSQFTSDPSHVAYLINIMNALLSALCILFLFWTITHLARRLILKDWESLTTAKLIAIEASGMVGALIYTWSDTFWFSAVEGEVYAYSSAFTAVVFWLILKWEDHADEPHSDRYLVLIAYMTGLSIGVHLLNLLCIPAIVLVFYYKRFPNADLKGSIFALIISAIIVAAVLYGVVPGIITVGGWFELFFVNTLGMSFNTGLIVYIILLVATVIWAIRESYTEQSLKRQNISFILAIAMLGIPFYGYGWSAFFIGVVVLALLYFGLKQTRKDGTSYVTARVKNTITLCMLMLMIGYSTYAVIVIRSSANPPMDQNSPEDIFTLGNYLSRDQYGYRPLLYGQAYTSEYAATSDGHVKMSSGAPIWQRKEKASADEPDSYFIVSRKENPEYVQNMVFPRMYSAAHTSAYESWMGGVTGRYVPSAYGGDPVKMPTMIENLKFFLSYQCNFMYWRYFMWNFAGRQNDIQGYGELEHGNWITGIPFIDNARLGNQETLPDDLKNNKGHNVFYCLPLLLGLTGMFWQAFRGQRGIRQFWVVFFLFFMTGLAIVLYLNQTPNQPRERDYAYAGSFYAYAIWCGLGVVALIDLLKRINFKGTVAAAIVGAACLLVPIQMVSQTWDDHDRSGRYTCRDFGQNYLMSLQEAGHPIIYTNGDNDTFPLWYNQEVEGVRTDARVCNLSYLQTDWYIDQMKRPAYESPSVPISWPRLDYCAGTNEIVSIQPDLKEGILDLYKKDPEGSRQLFGDNPFELKNILKIWVRGDLTPDQQAMMNALFGTVDGRSQKVQVIPTDTVYMTIDKEAVRKSGMMIPNDSIPDKMVISLKGHRSLGKGDLMMLEMLSQCNWVRPLYVAITVGDENYMNLGDNTIQEGLAYRITPFTTKSDDRFDVDKTYDMMMNKYKYGGLSTEGIYLDQTVYRMCCTHKRLFGQLALALANKGDLGRARKALEKMEKEMPEYNIPYEYLSGGLDIIKAYGMVGDKKQATHVADQMWKNSKQYLSWYMNLDPADFYTYQRECQMHMMFLSSVVDAMNNVDEDWVNTHYNEMRSLFGTYQSRGGQMPGYQ